MESNEEEKKEEQTAETPAEEKAAETPAAEKPVEQEKPAEKPAEPEKTANKIAFDEMNLQVGTRMQLITHGTKKTEFFSSLIGFELGRFLFIRVPQESSYVVPLKPMDRVDVRIFTGVSIYTFRSLVEHIYLTPRNFIELTFPDTIYRIPLRKDIRIKTSMPVTILKVEEEALASPHTTTALDLSATGIMVQGPNDFGKVNDDITISFTIKNTATNENAAIEIEGTIRNVRTDTGTTGEIIYKHGILFKELRPFHHGLIQNHINESIMRGR